MGFVFATCRPGLERWLRADVAREYPDLRPAFARPGMITFKSEGDVAPEFRARSPFARVSGASIGAAKTLEDVLAARDRVGAARVHVFVREPAKNREHDVFGPAEATRTALALDPDAERAVTGDLVLDVIVAPDQPYWLGVHRHERARSPFAGGRVPIIEPPEIPSRAYRKMAEALAWSGAPVLPGQTVLEFGSSPGGSALALLERGALVVGSDTEPIKPAVFAYGERFRHIPKAMTAIERADLPPGVAWLVMDVGVAPQVALNALRRFFPPYRKSLKGVLLTLKLNDDLVAAEIPTLLERVRSLGLTEVRATHLPSNRRELFVYGRS